MITVTCSIGQSVLRSAIRLRDNYITRKTIPNMPAGEGVTIVYNNETNRYKVGNPINRNAILLLLLLHLSHPDSNGIIRSFDCDEAADILGCHKKTVVNNLKILDRENYIFIQKRDIPYHYSVIFCHYKTYFNKAKDGGRGYITLTRSTFDQLCKMPTLNSLRLAIRSIIDTEEALENKTRIQEKSYRELKRDLPNYVTREKIEEAICCDAFRDMFHVTAKKYTINVMLKDEYHIIRQKRELQSSCMKQAAALVMSLNKKSKNKQHRLILSDTDKKDIAQISLTYPVETILKSLELIFINYIQAEKAIESLGALIRTLADQYHSFNSAA